MTIFAPWQKSQVSCACVCVDKVTSTNRIFICGFSPKHRFVPLYHKIFAVKANRTKKLEHKHPSPFQGDTRGAYFFRKAASAVTNSCWLTSFTVTPGILKTNQEKKAKQHLDPGIIKGWDEARFISLRKVCEHGWQSIIATAHNDKPPFLTFNSLWA